MKTGEVLRIIIFSIIGWVTMFLVQPWLFSVVLASPLDFDTEEWLSVNLLSGSIIVFSSSLISQLLWSGMAIRASVTRAADVYPWKVVWWLLGLLPIVGICFAIYYNTRRDVLFELISFYILDFLLLFWLPTASSSPGILKYIPPGSLFLRLIIGF